MAQETTNATRRKQESTTVEVLTAVAKNHKIALKGVKRVAWSFKVKDRLTIDVSVSAPASMRDVKRVSQATGTLDVEIGDEELAFNFDNKFSWFTSKYIELDVTLEYDESATGVDYKESMESCRAASSKLDLIWIQSVLMQAVRRCPASTAAPTDTLKVSLTTALEECTAVLEDSRQKWNA
jgi:hypothetical protein